MNDNTMTAGVTHDTSDLGAPPQMLIDGQWQSASDGKTLEVINPSTEQVIARVPLATDSDVDRAVRAARAQMDGGAWSQMSGVDRRRVMIRFADLIERNAKLLIRLESLNVGKVVGEPTMLDIPMSVETIAYFAGWADKIEGRTIPTPGYMGRRTLSYTLREPVGVIGAITPWNAPTMIACWKLGPALAAGCAIVMKVSEEAPLTALVLGKLALEAGVPPGVFNVITGSGEIAGAALTRHPGVDKISFTGSPEVGREIQRAAADTFKRVTLELGGKSPQIVLGDAQLDAALGGCAMGLFANQGQICAAGTRIFVHRSRFAEFSEKFSAIARSIVPGDPFDGASRMGTLISRKQLERVSKYVEVGTKEGAKVIAGGSRVSRPGFFFEPTVFTDVSNTMRIAREEIFGPVGALIPFDTVDEAIRLANDTRYGLAATIWTQELSAAHVLAAKVRAGAISINGWATIDPRLPWGGFKESGIGRELGRNGIESCTEEKVVTVVL